MTENLLMAAVRKGCDRQKAHGVIRDACMRKAADLFFDLTGFLLSENGLGAVLTEEELGSCMDPARYTGRCGEQVSAYLKKIAPLLSEADAVMKETEEGSLL